MEWSLGGGAMSDRCVEGQQGASLRGRGQVVPVHAHTLTPRSFQSGNNSFMARGSSTAPERVCAPTANTYMYMACICM